MAWPPPFINNPSFTACRTALPRSTPPIERPEPVPIPPGSSAMAGGPREFFLEPRGHQPDHAGMPALRGRDNDGTLVFEPERGQRLGFGLRLRHLFDDAALGIEAVELGGDSGGFGNIALQQQPHAEIGAPDPPPRIDPRSQHKTEMPGLGRT